MPAESQEASEICSIFRTASRTSQGADCTADSVLYKEQMEMGDSYARLFSFLIIAYLRCGKVRTRKTGFERFDIAF